MPGDQFIAFVQAVRRRIVLTRLLERIGLATLWSSLAALCLLTLLLWYGQSTAAVVETSLLIGLFAGIAWGLFRRPTSFQAALLVDRQLQTAELFSSAWLCLQTEVNPANPWLGHVLLEADRRSADLSPHSLIVRRLGGRSWAAVVLATALATLLGGFGPPSSKSGSDSHGNRSNLLALGSIPRDDRSTSDAFVSLDNRPILLGDPDDADGSHFGQNAAPAPANSAHSKPSENFDPRISDSTSSTEAGSGHGSARTKSATNSANSLNPTGPAGPGTDSAERSAKPTVGVGSPTGITRDGTALSAGLNGGSTPAASPTPALPWNASDWPNDIQRAQSALSAGRIPAQYRDLIHGYFSDTN